MSFALPRQNEKVGSLPVHVEGVVRFELVARPHHEFQLLDRYAQDSKDCFEQKRVVFCAPFEGFK